MLVAWHAEVRRVANVSAELEGVIAGDLRPVVHKLDLILGFQKRAVAAIDAQAETYSADAASSGDVTGVLVLSIAKAPDQVSGLTGGKVVSQIETGNSDVCGRGCSYSLRYDAHVVSDKPETEIGQ